ncbi:MULTISPECIES: NIL domain-containing protein [Desulfofundulus]|jgi:ferredoxin|uniref:4Fe-4S dicluster domain-containing protein n=3 Tax=Desulfofundulus TaxID=2282741 RepID=A0A494X2E8_9FIRM|nr:MULTISPECIES: NIL domain-containing protein [Desulfofundulus]AEG15224.1 NIL domain-containing protein [Desulfofundulus kuznetsovii DSM 6115]NHM28327.1 4Fe-4S binding protein [Desulfofundulus sp. TPOSR]RKO67014.1 4Fe-4S dicluster domain-containing protein [Desulfofundulus salinum]SHJ54423.1 4Fe-4S dicluster domain-containing protein [Desulfofundulus thermosubterraneus DSM 16057]
MSPRKIVLRFGPEISDKPIIYRLVKDYDLVMNIVKANVNPQKEGIMVLELTGDNYEQGLKYLREQGVTVQALTHEVVRNEQRCTMCGACTAICPTGALYLDRPGMEVRFDGDSCVVCQLCVKACPVRAMEVKL